MNNWLAAASKPKLSSQQELEESLIKVAHAEMQKSDTSEYLDSLFENTTSPNLDHLMARVKVAERMGQVLAHDDEMQKQAGIVGEAIGKIAPMAGKALGFAAKNPNAALAVGGGLAGAAMSSPGNRAQGAMMGAGLGYGAGRMGASTGMRTLANKGLGMMPKMAGIGMQLGQAAAKTLGKAGIAGAGIGAVAGGLHSTDAERMGQMPTHHLRNAIGGALTGGMLGQGMGRLGGGAIKSELGAVSHMPGRSPTPSMMGQSYAPHEVAQMNRVRDVARQQHAMRDPGLASTRPQAPAMTSTPTIGGKPQRAMMATKMAGAAFIKWAMSMNAQAEPGTPSGGQDQEEGQTLVPPSPPKSMNRPDSLPAKQLYTALSHLSPKSMPMLQGPVG